MNPLITYPLSVDEQIQRAQQAVCSNDVSGGRGSGGGMSGGGGGGSGSSGSLCGDKPALSITFNQGWSTSATTGEDPYAVTTPTSNNNNNNNNSTNTVGGGSGSKVDTTFYQQYTNSNHPLTN